MLQALQERRILADMTYAAEHGLVYHLWWHPHNFGAYLEQNLASLRKILDCFRIMRESNSTVFHAGSGNGLNRSARRDEVESFKAWS